MSDPRRATTRRHLVVRQSSAHLGALVVIASVVAVSSLLACASPRALAQIYDDGLSDAIEDAGPAGRDLVANAGGRAPLADGNDPLSGIARATDLVRAELDPVLAATVTATTYSVTSDRLAAQITPEGPIRTEPITRLQLRTADDWADHVRIVEGSPPSGELPAICASPPEVSIAVEECIVEIALTVEAAAAMEFALGDLVPLSDEVGYGGQPVLVRVTGLFEPLDPDDDYWSRSARALFPVQVIDFNTGLNNDGIAFVAPGAYVYVERQIVGLASSNVEARLLTDPTRFTSSNVGAVVDALDRLPTRLVEGPDGEAVRLTLRSLLAGVLADHLARQATAEAVMSVAGAGALAVAIAVLWLAARLLTERRRSTLALAGARGASPAQLATVQTIEGVVVAAPAAALGAWLAAWWVGGPAHRTDVVVPVLLTIATAVIVPVVGRARTAPGTRSDLWRRLVRPGQRAAELTVVVVAVIGVIVLRQRGLTTQAADVGTDPLLSAVPVLLAVAAGIVVLRLLPVLLHRLSKFTARRADAVPFLGLARSGREVAGGTAPVLVLLLALSTATFASVVTSTLAHGAVVASWQNVGADLRVGGTSIDDGDVQTAQEIAGVSGVAPTAIDYEGELEDGDAVAVVATDIAAYREVQRSNPAAPPLPASLDPPDDPTPGGPTTAVVSSSLAATGDRMQVVVRGAELTLDVVATATSLPGIDADVDWVLVPLSSVSDTPAGRSPDTAYVGLDSDLSRDPATLQRVSDDLLEALPGAAVVTSRDALLDDTAGSGLVAGVQGIFVAGTLVAAVFSAVGVVLAVIITARQRDVVLSRLRTLGLSGRQTRWLVALEILPLVTAALVCGVVLGLVTPWLLEPAIDLRPFTGGDLAAPLTVDGWSLLAVVVGFAVAVCLTIVLITAVNRRQLLGSVLRVGEEA